MLLGGGETIEPELFFFLEGFPRACGDFLDLAYAMFNEDHFAERAVSGSQIEGLVVRRRIHNKNNDVVVVGRRNVESLYLICASKQSLENGAFLFLR